MTSTTMHDAKTNLSKLVSMLESGNEERIVILRGSKPVAMLVPYQPINTSMRLGVAEGLFDVPDNIDMHNDKITLSFEGGK